MKKIKEFFAHNKYEFLRAFIYFVVFAVVIVFFEVALRIMISGKISKANVTFLAFVPAQAMFFTTLTGFAKKHTVINKLIFILLMVLITAFYGVQMVYFQVFGSVLSVSLLGMGTEAVGNFSWAIASILKNVWKYIVLFLMPIILAIVFSFVKKLNKSTKNMPGAGYVIWLHALCLVLTVGLWFAGIGGLKTLGTERNSAYYVLNDAYADSDTTATRLGVLSTSVIEAAARYLHIKGKDNEVTVVAVDNNALNLGKPDTTSNPTANTVSNDTQEGTDEEQVVEPEEVFVSELQINEAIDFAALAQIAPDSDTRQLCEYYGSKSGSGTNKYTGMFEGYNLIYICAESFSRYALDPEITPLMYEMANNGIVLSNYYNSFRNTTSNGEFAFDTSCWPDVSRVADNGAIIGSFPQSANIYMPYGLGDYFNSIDVPVYGFHNFWGNYYYRYLTWPNLGYNNNKFLGQGMNFTSYWPASDLEMFEQSVDDFINDDQFHAYYMTFSGHGPYSPQNYMYNKNIEAVKELAGGRYGDNTEALGYFCGEYELELGLEYLVEKLEEAGKLDKTVIVLTGDHYPYYVTSVGQAAFEDTIDDNYNDFEIYRSTCIIYNSGIEEPIINDEYCCNVDILPTILNLFGFDYESRLLAGNDVFSDSVHRARIYNGSFLTKYVKYNSRTGEVTWTEEAEGFSEYELNSYLDAMLNYTESEYTASLLLQSSNFYFFVYKNSGLMTPEEIAAEQRREENGNAFFEEEILAQEQQALEEEMAAQGLNPDGTPIEDDGTNPEGVNPEEIQVEEVGSE